MQQQLTQAQDIRLFHCRGQGCLLHESQALGLANRVLDLAFDDERSLLSGPLLAAECLEVHSACLFPLILLAVGAW